MKKKVIHRLRIGSREGRPLVALQTKCGYTFFSLTEEGLKKKMEEGTSRVPEEVTCKNCLRCTAAMQRKNQLGRR